MPGVLEFRVVSKGRSNWQGQSGHCFGEKNIEERNATASPGSGGLMHRLLRFWSFLDLADELTLDQALK